MPVASLILEMTSLPFFAFRKALVPKANTSSAFHSSSLFLKFLSASTARATPVGIILLRERVPVRIGVGGLNQNTIIPTGVARAVEALKNFKNKLDEWKADEVFAFGTSALRNAKNGSEVISKIKEATGIETKIISGDEEALYIYEGVNLALNLGKEKSLIMDIGGGSVEFIIGNGEEIFLKQNF